MSTANTVVVIAGPTASGKSWLAAKLAQRRGGTVINADSLQLYDALPILTARPGIELTCLAPHSLYGALAYPRRATAAWWAEAARGEIERAQADGRLPILVGGTGLYFEALMHGLAAIPEIEPSVRAQAIMDLTELGRDAFFRRLVAADAAAARLNAGDTQRVLRAWEVYSGTGRPLGEWQAVEVPSTAGYDYRTVLVLPPRERLRTACDMRFAAMIAAGAAGEVKEFLEDFPRDAPAARALGFVAISAYLDGQIGRDEAIARGQAETRQYAKRQVTWFRNRFLRFNPTAIVLESADVASLERIEPLLRA